MSAWVIWVIVAGALVAGEILTLGFLLAPIAVAALLAALVALVGGGVALQLIAFIVGSIASFAIIRPVAKAHLRAPARLRTGTAALEGARGVVVERVDSDGGKVKIGGEIWTARAFAEHQVIEPGTRVEVAQIQGATALVYE